MIYSLIYFGTTIVIFIVSLFAYIFHSGALRDLVLFVQFKKRKKHPWRSVNFNKVAG